MQASPVNVTAIKTKEDYYIKHVLDSLYFLMVLNPLPEVKSIIDIGSGGGFPGIPLAICFPGVKLTLADSIAKKCRYLESAVEKLGLENVEVINNRAEKLSGSYDLVTARGVGSVKEVYNYTHQLVKKGWLMYKGERLDAELAEASHIINKKGLKSVIRRMEEPFTRSYLYLHY